MENRNFTPESSELREAQMALQKSTTFTANMKQAMTDVIKAEVKTSTLTQTQANLLIANLDKMPMGFGGGMPGKGGPEGGRPGMGGPRMGAGEGTSN